MAPPSPSPDLLSTALVVSVELPALNVQERLDFAFSAEAQDRILDVVRDLVEDVVDELGPDLVGASEDTVCLPGRLEELRARAVAEFEGVRRAIVESQQTAEEMKGRVQRATAMMNKMRESYFKELSTLKEQLYRQQQASLNGDDFEFEHVKHFEPSKFVVDPEVEALLAQQVEIMEQEFRFKLADATKKYQERIATLNEQLADAKMKLKRKEKLMERIAEDGDDRSKQASAAKGEQASTVRREQTSWQTGPCLERFRNFLVATFGSLDEARRGLGKDGSEKVTWAGLADVARELGFSSNAWSLLGELLAESAAPTLDEVFRRLAGHQPDEPSVRASPSMATPPATSKSSAASKRWKSIMPSIGKKSKDAEVMTDMSMARGAPVDRGVDAMPYHMAWAIRVRSRGTQWPEQGVVFEEELDELGASGFFSESNQERENSSTTPTASEPAPAGSNETDSNISMDAEVLDSPPKSTQDSACSPMLPRGSAVWDCGSAFTDWPPKSTRDSACSPMSPREPRELYILDYSRASADCDVGMDAGVPNHIPSQLDDALSTCSPDSPPSSDKARMRTRQLDDTLSTCSPDSPPSFGKAGTRTRHGMLRRDYTSNSDLPAESIQDRVHSSTGIPMEHLTGDVHAGGSKLSIQGKLAHSPRMAGADDVSRSRSKDSASVGNARGRALQDVLLDRLAHADLPAMSIQDRVLSPTMERLTEDAHGDDPALALQGRDGYDDVSRSFSKDSTSAGKARTQTLQSMLRRDYPPNSDLPTTSIQERVLSPTGGSAHIGGSAMALQGVGTRARRFDGWDDPRSCSKDSTAAGKARASVPHDVLRRDRRSNSELPSEGIQDSMRSPTREESTEDTGDDMIPYFSNDSTSSAGKARMRTLPERLRDHLSKDDFDGLVTTVAPTRPASRAARKASSTVKAAEPSSVGGMPSPTAMLRGQKASDSVCRSLSHRRPTLEPGSGIDSRGSRYAGDSASLPGQPAFPGLQGSTDSGLSVDTRGGRQSVDLPGIQGLPAVQRAQTIMSLDCGIDDRVDSSPVEEHVSAMASQSSRMSTIPSMPSKPNTNRSPVSRMISRTRFGSVTSSTEGAAPAALAAPAPPPARGGGFAVPVRTPRRSLTAATAADQALGASLVVRGGTGGSSGGGRV